MDVGVKQGCVLPPTIFNMFISAVTQHILELQYADHCALLAHSPESLQRVLNVVSSIYSAIGLQINVNKTQILVQQFTPQPNTPIFTIDGQPSTTTPHFTYLGSTLSPSCTIDDDVQACIGLASAAFGRLRFRIFLNRNFTISTKTAHCLVG